MVAAALEVERGEVHAGEAAAALREEVVSEVGGHGVVEGLHRVGDEAADQLVDEVGPGMERTRRSKRTERKQP